MISIDVLPDDVLLSIFDSYPHDEDLGPDKRTRAWQSLIHVCRRWRSVIFGSPRRLDLRLFCTESTRSRDMLDIWPALPLIIKSNWHHSARSVDNIAAALKCSNRVCYIQLFIGSIFCKTLEWEIFLAAMQQPFPELTHLRLSWSGWDDNIGETVVLPDSFLGGFVPRLEFLELHRLPFPCLPLTSSIFALMIFAIPGTFHPTRWSPPFPR